MSEEKLDINLDLKDLRLSYLTVEKTADEQVRSRDNKIEILEYEEDDQILKLKYTDKVVSEMKIHLELTATMEIESEISLDIIENIIETDSVNDLAMPLLNEASHIISFITSKTEFMPLILPPLIIVNEEKSDV